MWVMTSFGILMPAIRPPKTVDPGDERTLQIRTRREKDLDILRARYMPTTLGPTISTPKMDYEFRAYCTPHAWALALANMTLDLVDYTKFKPSTEDKFGDKPLHQCYNAIWGVVVNHLGTPRFTHYSSWGDYPGTNGYTGGPYRDWSDLGKHALPSSTGWGGTTYRSTAADRDTYEPESGEPDEAWVNPAVETLYQEMERLLDEQDGLIRTDHADCQHGGSPAAKARCRRRRKADNNARIQEIRTILDESYADAAGDAALAGEVVSPE